MTFALIITLWLGSEAEEITLANGMTYTECVTMLAKGIPEYVPSFDPNAPALATREFQVAMSCADESINR